MDHLVRQSVQISFQYRIRRALFQQIAPTPQYLRPVHRVALPLLDDLVSRLGPFRLNGDGELWRARHQIRIRWIPTASRGAHHVLEVQLNSGRQGNAQSRGQLPHALFGRPPILQQRYRRPSRRIEFLIGVAIKQGVMSRQSAPLERPPNLQSATSQSQSSRSTASVGFIGIAARIGRRGVCRSLPCTGSFADVRVGCLCEPVQPPHDFVSTIIEPTAAANFGSHRR